MAAKQEEIDDTRKSIDELTAKLKELEAELPAEPAPPDGAAGAPQDP